MWAVLCPDALMRESLGSCQGLSIVPRFESGPAGQSGGAQLSYGTFQCFLVLVRVCQVTSVSVIAAVYPRRCTIV